jgi:hypothetical protein
MQFVIRDFALNPNRAEFRFERAADAARQLEDAQDFGRALEEIRLHYGKRSTLNAQRPTPNSEL